MSLALDYVRDSKKWEQPTTGSLILFMQSSNIQKRVVLVGSTSREREGLAAACGVQNCVQNCAKCAKTDRPTDRPSDVCACV